MLQRVRQSEDCLWGTSQNEAVAPPDIPTSVDTLAEAVNKARAGLSSNEHSISPNTLRLQQIETGMLYFSLAEALRLHPPENKPSTNVVINTLGVAKQYVRAALRDLRRTANAQTVLKYCDYLAERASGLSRIHTGVVALQQQPENYREPAIQTYLTSGRQDINEAKAHLRGPGVRRHPSSQYDAPYFIELNEALRITDLAIAGQREYTIVTDRQVREHMLGHFFSARRKGASQKAPLIKHPIFNKIGPRPSVLLAEPLRNIFG